MKVGSLVKAKHWSDQYIAIIVSIRQSTGICKVMLVGGDYMFDQLIRDLEVICE